jgi:phage tail-like protein
VTVATQESSSSRGLIAGAVTARPIGQMLPGIYQDDEFTQRWTAAFDEVLAPVFTTLDSIFAYVDPALAPSDFLGWLCAWMGADPGEFNSLDRQREFVASAMVIHRWRGTTRALSELVRLHTGRVPHIDDGCAVLCFDVAQDARPDDTDRTIVVSLDWPGASDDDMQRLDAVVTAAKPAHLIHHLQVTR